MEEGRVESLWGVGRGWRHLVQTSRLTNSMQYQGVQTWLDMEEQEK